MLPLDSAGWLTFRLHALQTPGFEASAAPSRERLAPQLLFPAHEALSMPPVLQVVWPCQQGQLADWKLPEALPMDVSGHLPQQAVCQSPGMLYTDHWLFYAAASFAISLFFGILATENGHHRPVRVQHRAYRTTIAYPHSTEQVGKRPHTCC